MITGYSAFNTNIKLSAKWNVYNKGDLCYETSDNKDGTLTITNYAGKWRDVLTSPNLEKNITLVFFKICQSLYYKPSGGFKHNKKSSFNAYTC